MGFTIKITDWGYGVYADDVLITETVTEEEAQEVIKEKRMEAIRTILRKGV